MKELVHEYLDNVFWLSHQYAYYNDKAALYSDLEKIIKDTFALDDEIEIGYYIDSWIQSIDSDFDIKNYLIDDDVPSMLNNFKSWSSDYILGVDPYIPVSRLNMNDRIYVNQLENNVAGEINHPDTSCPISDIIEKWGDLIEEHDIDLPQVSLPVSRRVYSKVLRLEIEPTYELDKDDNWKEK